MLIGFSSTQKKKHQGVTNESDDKNKNLIHTGAIDYNLLKHIDFLKHISLHASVTVSVPAKLNGFCCSNTRNTSRHKKKI